jgi:ketosteroid isomerase-like protein
VKDRKARHRVRDRWRSRDVEISEVDAAYTRNDNKMPLDVNGLFDTVDRQDAEGFGMFFTEDGLFRFGNAPTVKGRSEISASVSQFFESIKALRHRILDTWRSGDVEICEVEVTYTRHDDTTVDLMAACLFRMQGDRIADYRIYMDISPLHAAS